MKEKAERSPIGPAELEAETSPLQDQADLNRFRGYLHLLARLELEKNPQAKLEASDIVQQTLLQAHAKRNQYRGQNDAEFAGWLRAILGNCMTSARRAHGREKRDAFRERSLQAALDASSMRLEAFLAVQQPSPSGEARRHEDVIRLADALTKLDDKLRQVVVLRYFQEWTFEQIAQELGCTAPAVLGMARRAGDALRRLLDEKE